MHNVQRCVLFLLGMACLEPHALPVYTFKHKQSMQTYKCINFYAKCIHHDTDKDTFNIQ